jgi:hypothetical protein
MKDDVSEAASTSFCWQEHDLLWWMLYIRLLSVTPFLAEDEIIAGSPKDELHQIYTTYSNKEDYSS